MSEEKIDNVFSLSKELEENDLSDSNSEYNILYQLAAMGVNKATSSYSDEHKQIQKDFCKLPANIIFKMWPKLSSNVKVKYVDSNLDLFMEWLKDA